MRLSPEPFSRYSFVILLALLLGTGACSTDKNGDRVLFAIEEDLKLGEQVALQVDSTYRAKGQLLERSNPRYRTAYAFLDNIVERILSSGEVSYREEFPWKVTIINDPETQNAFATPGGHIYVFTGLIKTLDNEDQLAGVLGHEIAHADQRHTVKQLQKQYGISFVLSLFLDENSGDLQRTVAQIAGQMAGLKFSRDYERESDAFSVVYLAGTNYYACDGAAGFFQKMQALEQSGNMPEFISTHPSPGNRIHDIEQKAQQVGCSTEQKPTSGYAQFKSSLGL
ncbi:MULTISPECIES: M48 family metalloprotease [Rufibacter]|uniref:Putative Zn-dependent protease n=1 Tax=Rufibacter quisquiliarum TaxID=1549639 RepID=A0A839GJA8_9BACT|nr:MULTISPECIES: M48 family metalloprotease [Rufibacter]MBA9078710.1 putative Zn-dependent protease [Rufibacter quisquiliarum]